MMVALRPTLTLMKKETLRFGAVPLQAIVAPVISATLFLFVFGLSLGSRLSIFEGYSYAQFVIPGLILMGVVNNAFINSSSSLFFSRYIGNIVDLLVTPIGPLGIALGYCLPAMLRGLVVGVAIWGIASFFAPLPVVYPWAALAMAVLSAFLFAILGLLAALVSNGWETLSTFNNFLILPLIYLGGLFYPTSILPPFWGWLSQFNPLYYLIDGFRQALLGEGETQLWLDLTITTGLCAVLFTVLLFVFHKGYRLRN